MPTAWECRYLICFLNFLFIHHFLLIKVVVGSLLGRVVYLALSLFSLSVVQANQPFFFLSSINISTAV